LRLSAPSNDRFSYADAVNVLRNNLPAVVAAGAYPVDGSGLSRHNLISPAAFRALFEQMYERWPSAAFDEFVSFLPLAGRSGTLASRFRNSPAQDILHAKTGTETGLVCCVVSLCHYVSTACLSRLTQHKFVEWRYSAAKQCTDHCF
jgi:D-alanyl-D-alanine carboxypeptidase/D-alanyl-D-alanine-endopeptidase (penicillin-binding protein 4)